MTLTREKRLFVQNFLLPPNREEMLLEPPPPKPNLELPDGFIA